MEWINRLEKKGWQYLEVAVNDAATFRFPERTDAMLAAFSMKAMLDYKSVIHRIAQVLVPGKRFVFLERVLPDRALRLLGYNKPGGNHQG